jgi:hypothetical protein
MTSNESTFTRVRLSQLWCRVSSCRVGGRPFAIAICETGFTVAHRIRQMEMSGVTNWEQKENPDRGLSQFASLGGFAGTFVSRDSAVCLG